MVLPLMDKWTRASRYTLKLCNAGDNHRGGFTPSAGAALRSVNEPVLTARPAQPAAGRPSRRAFGQIVSVDPAVTGTGLAATRQLQFAAKFTF
jgi:hypothetical protein